MLEVKYQSKPFQQMPANDLAIWGNALLLKIHSITGWTIPENTMLTVLTDQFRKKLQESYPTCNPDEIEYAFRNYGTTVQDWGKQMNLGLIDQVMIPYLSRRAELSKVEEQKALVLIEGPKESTGDDAMQEWLEDVKKKAHAGTLKFAFIPLDLYHWLVKKGELRMPAAKKGEYLQQAVAYRKSLYLQSLEEREDPEIRARLRAFTAMIEMGEITGDEIRVVEGITRRKILLDHLFSLPV